MAETWRGRQRACCADTPSSLLSWMDGKALQQLQIASMLSSVAMEYGDVGAAADVLAKVSGMVNDQRELVRCSQSCWQLK